MSRVSLPSETLRKCPPTAGALSRVTLEIVGDIGDPPDLSYS